MKNSRFLIVLILALTGILGRVSAQDAFYSNEKSFRFEPLRHSNFFIKDGNVKLNLYGPTKQTSGKFVIPMELMYQYIYTDTASVIGTLDHVIMARVHDFDYVSNICLKAQADCRLHYKTWKGATYGTLFLTMLQPVAGLAIAVPASLTPPRIENLGLSDVDMLQEDIYFHVYRKEAQKMKSKRTWMAYGIGLGIHLGIVFGIVAACQ